MSNHRLPQPPFEVETEHGALHGIAFDVFGPEAGVPMFWFHGSPSCRLEARLLGSWAHEVGRRLVAIDRPGVGRSEPRSRWSMSDVIFDVVQIADYLGWNRFGVAGGSGGGPFVLAAAALAPERLTFAVSLACAGAFEHVTAGWVDRIGQWATRVPGALDGSFSALRLVAQATPPVWVGRAAAPLGWLLGTPSGAWARFAVEMVREATHHGSHGLAEDTRVLHRPWGFDLEAVRAPVTLVAGDRDPFIPLHYTQNLKARIPAARLEVATGADHFQTIFDLPRLTRLTDPGS
ncbi:MAG: alpha/beta fold hydrolase [Myxococcota bacterium]